MSPTPTLVLASRSPQRQAILRQLGVEFEVRPVDVEEVAEGPPEVVAVANAERKAMTARDVTLAATILGVDTVVALEGRIYGKPASVEEARATLAALSGRTHDVVSGLALWRDGELKTSVAVTSVTFRRLDQALLDWYLATDEWRDRAGGYAIQGRGAALVEAISGDYLNVVGLPVAALLDLWPSLIFD